MPTWDLLLTGARIATMRADAGPWGLLEDGALSIAGGRIAWVGPRAGMPPGTAAETRDLAGAWLTPALIDCHTHLVFAGNRAAEFEQRLKGASYAEIAAAGGGILSTVRATRAADREALVEGSARRLASLVREGVATVEIKSGYGLDRDTELRMLEAARSLGASLGVSVSTTFLGAHALPPEFAGRRDDYLRFLVDEVLPAVAASGLADSVDAYCERIAFSADEVSGLFERALELGLPVRLHADQLSDCGGAELAASYGALSADHLEYTPERGVRALAAAGTVAVLLPGAYLTLRETQLPPVEALRAHGVPLALATDCNPGTSPLCSIRTAMSLAATLFRMTPEECLAGVTREAAKALGLGADRGTLEPGKRADIAAWDIAHPAELSYWLGLDQLRDLYVSGRRLER
ncbi:MAG: imidazolonepropionase [Gammaproteobacteria bacterium]|nr:imidazolonepropionase [Gammaproteobacteria bacterium]MDH4255030.1 imidazolonepropionase [Gammaproteobacteria bacterium]MDH5309269.1 imidazolonepropionase [Gammaproteobacteria bacterium]